MTENVSSEVQKILHLLPASGKYSDFDFATFCKQHLIEQPGERLSVSIKGPCSTSTVVTETQTFRVETNRSNMVSDATDGAVQNPDGHRSHSANRFDCNPGSLQNRDWYQAP